VVASERIQITKQTWWVIKEKKMADNTIEKGRKSLANIRKRGMRLGARGHVKESGQAA